MDKSLNYTRCRGELPGFRSKVHGLSTVEAKVVPGVVRPSIEHDELPLVLFHLQWNTWPVVSQQSGRRRHMQTNASSLAADLQLVLNTLLIMMSMWGRRCISAWVCLTPSEEDGRGVMTQGHLKKYNEVHLVWIPLLSILFLRVPNLHICERTVSTSMADAAVPQSFGREWSIMHRVESGLTRWLFLVGTIYQVREFPSWTCKKRLQHRLPAFIL